MALRSSCPPMFCSIQSTVDKCNSCKTAKMATIMTSFLRAASRTLLPSELTCRRLPQKAATSQSKTCCISKAAKANNFGHQSQKSSKKSGLKSTLRVDSRTSEYEYILDTIVLFACINKGSGFELVVDPNATQAVIIRGEKIETSSIPLVSPPNPLKSISIRINCEPDSVS